MASILPSVTLHLNPWRNYENFQHHTLAQRHEYMVARLENARRREWVWVVIVAGIGFFTDAYAIFSVNMVVPMLETVYWQNTDEHVRNNYKVALSISTLGGALVGQVLFGIAADIWGRRKMYGLELGVLIFTTIGLALSSEGAFNSMSLVGLLIFWRFFMGLGLGGDYPLSAVICSEFAPTRIRGRMLAAVFCCQSLGALAANLVALIAVAGFRHQLPHEYTGTHCDGDCIREVDRIWRLIVGLGAVPAFIALWFRLTIVESPRYTAEVTQNSLQAAADVAYFFQSEENPTMPEMRQVAEDNAISPTTSRPDSYPSSINSGQSSMTQEAIPPVNIRTFWTSFKAFAARPRVFRLLFATCSCWFFLDLPFYGLGLISPDVIQTIWSSSYSDNRPLYDTYFQISYRSMVVVSSGAVIGNLLAIFTIDRLGRRNMQLNGFFWLFILNLIIGGAFKPLARGHDSSALVVLYVLSQVFFNFGPNTTTYIIPAEIFPTRFRCTSHGLAAASGKLGSVIAQCFLAYVDFGSGSNHQGSDPANWLGYALLCLSAFMFLGLAVTYFFIPDVKDAKGEIKSLETLALDLMGPSRTPGEEGGEEGR
ncbi:major facilitator superfamily domain-containing protein [Aspergillus pseudoustus]|uniref:Major facilitator superfamily domain-containing protein n=1 Tax=Aspergillus pseudoustus TaxID=1810923 RepID=A0ABR4IF81_9EURO